MSVDVVIGRVNAPGDPLHGKHIEFALNPDGSLQSAAGARVPRTVYLVSQVLPATPGQFTPTTFYDIPQGVRVVTFWITYTRGAFGGYFEAHPIVSNGVEETNLPVIDSGISPQQQFGVQQAYLSSLYSPSPPNSAAETFTISIRVEGGETRVAIVFAEKGVTGSPGTIAVAVTAGR